MSDSFLVFAVLAFALTANALRPVPGTWFSVPTFFAGWLTSELAPQHLAGYLVIAALFVAGGGASGPAGAAALGVSVLTVAGLVALIVQARRVGGVFERALRKGLGDEYAADRSGSWDPRVPWRQLVLPFRMSHPEVERIRNVRYGEAGRRNMLDVYRHRSAPAGAPVLLFIHGGGWVISNKNHQGKPLMLHLASRGWVCVTANYRLSPRATFPDHIVDCKRALAWIREHVAEYGGDPSFVVVTGGSAGGHLAALMALTQNDPRYQPGFEGADTSVQACVPHYGVYDLTDDSGTAMARRRTRFVARVVIKKVYAADRDEFEKASPLFLVDDRTPPFFVIHGRNDSLVPVAETRRFIARLLEVSRAPVVYAELPGAQHAFDVFPSIRTAHAIRGVERFADWVHRTRAAARA